MEYCRRTARSLCFLYFYALPLKFVPYIICVLLIISGSKLLSQTEFFNEGKKWGLRSGEQVIVQPVYDTIYPFDSTNKICLACHRYKTASANKFMKVLTTSYACNYLNNKGEKLVVKNKKGDTCSIFAYNKSSLAQYSGRSPYFTASAKNRKFLLTKDFVQLTYNNYHDVVMSEDPAFYITQTLNEFDVPLTGMVNQKEEVIIPYLYSSIRLNTEDSLIVACSAAVRPNAEDDVYNYEGKKVASSTKHIDMATKNFLIHKLYEPKEHYLTYNLATRQETKLQADEVKFYQDDEILIRIKNEWFIYDLQTNQKKPKSKS
jgi:hypothetical protein